MKLEKDLGWRWEGRIFETRDVIAKEDVGEWGLKEGESLLEKKVFRVGTTIDTAPEGPALIHFFPARVRD